MTLHLPEGVLAERAQMAGVVSLQIRPELGKWTIRISTPRTSNPRSTVKDAMDKAVTDIAGNNTVRDATSGKALGSDIQQLKPATGQSRAIKAGTLDGERVVLSLPATGAAAKDGDRMIQGLAFFKPAADQFVIFELVGPQKELTEAGAIFEGLITSATFRDVAEINTERQKIVLAGDRMVSSISATDMDAAVADGPKWYRLYKPAASSADSDAEEMGYRSVKFWKGRRSELEGQGRDRGDTPDNPEGYLAEVSARLITRTNSGTAAAAAYSIVDTTARYFMTPDRQEESWTVTTALRDSRTSKVRTLGETGARRGASMTVQITEPGKPPRSMQPTVAPQAYLTQVETHLLPRILQRSGAETELGFYAYRSDSYSVTLRRDLTQRELGGAWTQTTTFREGDEPQKSVFRDDGELIRTVLPDGRMWTATTPQELKKLWERKGLPTGEK